MKELSSEHVYDMPTVFGPSPYSGSIKIERGEGFSVSFRTTREAAGALVPSFFEVTDPAIVTVSFYHNRGVSVFGGRGYKVIKVGIGARFQGGSEAVSGIFAPIIWEDTYYGAQIGRERLGYAKIFADVHDTVGHDSASFSGSEYGTRILEGEVTDLVPLTGDELKAVCAASASGVNLGWKYLPGTGTIPDVDYPVSSPMNFYAEQAWRGNGTLKFFTPNAIEAPHSSEALAALAKLPILEYLPAYKLIGPIEIALDKTKRLR